MIDTFVIWRLVCITWHASRHLSTLFNGKCILVGCEMPGCVASTRMPSLIFFSDARAKLSLPTVTGVNSLPKTLLMSAPWVFSRHPVSKKNSVLKPRPWRNETWAVVNVTWMVQPKKGFRTYQDIMRNLCYFQGYYTPSETNSSPLK